MFASWESGWGLDAVQALAAVRGPLGDALAQALHFGGGTLLFLVVLPIIYWSLQRELGTRLIFALTFSFALGELVKAQFGAPRPVDIAPTLISPLLEQGGFGFPSNHVLLTVAVWGYLAFYLRRRWGALAVALLVLAQMWGACMPACISRMMSSAASCSVEYRCGYSSRRWNISHQDGRAGPPDHARFSR